MLVLARPLLGQTRWAELERDFANPPQSAGMRCWWWWLNGNVTKEAITHDLEQMKAKGFSGACIFDAGGAEQRGNAQVPEGPMFGTPPWRELFVHAVKEADRLGLVLSLNIQSGWNLGGPDVTPAEATKHLTFTEIRVSGPGPIKQKLPQPKSRDDFYRDIAVLAFPALPGGAQAKASVSSQREDLPLANAIDGSSDTFWVSAGKNAGEGPTPQKPEWIAFELAEPAKVAQVRVLGRAGYSPKDCVVQVSDDGKTFKDVQRLKGTDGKEMLAKFAPVQSRHVRLLIESAYDRGAPQSRNVQVCEIAVLDEQGTAVAPGRTRKPVRDLRLKAAFDEVHMSAPDTRFMLDDFPATPGEEDAKLTDIINLTGKMQADGSLDWNAPRGEWIVMRFGYTPTGAKVSTSSGKWQGRVIDHMSRPIFQAYWDRHVEPLMRLIGPLAGKTLTHLQTDSWELGGINWTDDFAQQFKKRRGYDCVPYLPIIAGKIIDNRDTGTRFLADFRKTIGELIAEEHYGAFHDNAKRYGIGLQPESGGPHAGPFDALKNLRYSDIMMGEFWVPSPHRPKPEQRFFVKQAASAAHVYGKRLVGAEGFTSIGPHWNDTLWSAAKPSFDHEVCSGLNLLLVHTFTCSPKEMGLPGQEYFAGTHFNPQVTWWEMAGGFTSYISRCQVLLQQGQVVADVLYYYGDHVPNVAALKESDPAKVLPGYDYDIIDEYALLNLLSVKDEMLSVPSGAGWRVLVLPDHGVLSVQAMKKIGELKGQGARVIGLHPARTATLEPGREECDRQFQQAAADALKRRVEPSSLGTRPATRALSRAQVATGLPPDFEFRSVTEGAVFDYIHRRIDGADVYFVSNQSEKALRAELEFRVSGKRPELWDPLNGSRRPARAFTQAEGRTRVPLAFEPYGSMFVVFRSPIAAGDMGLFASNEATWKSLVTMDGPWDVRFDPAWGGPESVRFDKLVSWTDRPEPGIKFYSGTATYRTTFELKQPAQSHILIELGDIRDVGIARVRVNGKDCGVAWTPPFRVDISAAATAGANTLEVDVANSWRNRLIGDRDLPAEQRRTRTNVTVRPDWKLEPSGLMGPVRILESPDWKAPADGAKRND